MFSTYLQVLSIFISYKIFYRDQRILLHTIRLYSYFLIFTGLHSSSDLQDEQMRSSWLLLLDKLLHYKQCRLWFVNHIILNEVYSNIYLFQAPTAEVRMFYARAVYRAIIQMFEQEDTMEELLANEVRSVHLDKVLNAFGRRYPPPVGMMFDALIILARNSHDRPIEFYLIIIWMGMDASSQQFNIDTNVFLMMVRHRVLSLLMSLMGTKVIAQLNPHTMLLCAYPKLLCNLLRVVDLRPILQRTVKHEIRDRNPYQLVADSELIPATAIPDWQLSYLMDFVRCKGQKSVYSICEYLLGVAAFYDINSCPSWIRPSICYLAWNNQDCCKFLYDKILACILVSVYLYFHYLPVSFFSLSLFCILFIIFQFSYIEFPYGLSRTGQYISPEKNGLMGLMHGGLSHRRQMDMLRCIVLLVEEYGDLAVQVRVLYFYIFMKRRTKYYTSHTYLIVYFLYIFGSGAVDEMLLATSSSASDSQNQKPKSPPPAYDYTDLEPPGLENTEPSKKVAMSTLPAWNHS
uniref:Mediator complex subunit 23 n=1 Tax=Heterorhabditis bacteriophora TaxID=37862 RepID=A0A1I7WZ12_HETBA